jgi:hypothetical protein
MRKGGQVVYSRGGEDSSSNEVTEMGLGRKHSKVSGGGGVKGSGVMNSKKGRICLLNNTITATG